MTASSTASPSAGSSTRRRSLSRPEGDHYRTRLTHTLGGVANRAAPSRARLRLNEDLTEAIALGHDLGHTPFGHAGERALDERIPHCGFRHNEQSLRVVEQLEKDGKRPQPDLRSARRHCVPLDRRQARPTRWRGRLSIIPTASPTSTTISTTLCAAVCCTKVTFRPHLMRAFGQLRTASRINTLVLSAIRYGSHGPGTSRMGRRLPQPC